MNTVKDFARNVLTTLQYSFGELLVSNVLWVLLLIPIVTIPPAFAGLFYATHRLAHEEKVTRKTFFEGFRRYFRASYLWFLTNVVVLGILLFNIRFSLQISEEWLQALIGVYWVLLAVWLLIQIYTFPLLMEQDHPKLFLAIRNSLILWLKHGLFSFSLALVLAILTVISLYVFPFWFVITGSLIAYLANLGVVFLLGKERSDGSVS